MPLSRTLISAAVVAFAASALPVNFESLAAGSVEAMTALAKGGHGNGGGHGGGGHGKGGGHGNAGGHGHGGNRGVGNGPSGAHSKSTKAGRHTKSRGGPVGARSTN